MSSLKRWDLVDLLELVVNLKPYPLLKRYVTLKLRQIIVLNLTSAVAEIMKKMVNHSFKRKAVIA